MCENGNHLKARHSSHTSGTPKTVSSNLFSKSDLNMALPNSTSSSNECAYRISANLRLTRNIKSEEYYKKYEYDEIPVKDSDNETKIVSRSNNKDSLTNSYIDRIEKRVYENVSQELQTEETTGSLSSLESNIKFFKTTVEKIFENFYTSMSDYEHYKNRFHEILAKSKEGSIEDMEDFIKDMFEHIMSSENSSSNISHRSAKVAAPEVKDKVSDSNCGDDSYADPDHSTGVVEAFRNDNYLTDSTLDHSSSKNNGSSQIEEIFNIILLGDNPCIQIKLHDRNLLSEINIKEPAGKATTASIASADNFKKVAAKKLELEKYTKEQYDNNLPDRDIPVKISNPKKNIHLNEDFNRSTDHTECTMSFLTKICNILCKKFRKSTIG